MDVVPEKNIQLVFRWSLLAKAAFAVLEIAGGIAAYFVSAQFVLDVASAVTENELSGDPNDPVANFILQTAHSFSTSAQQFTAIYLLSHGIIKLFLITGLLKGLRWAYPTSLIVFTLFIVYQLFRYTITYSPWLIVISILDFFVLALTWHEYRTLTRARAVQM